MSKQNGIYLNRLQEFKYTKFKKISYYFSSDGHIYYIFNNYA